MAVPQVISGDDIAIPVQLDINQVPVVISPSATVKAAIVSSDRSRKIIGDSLLSDAIGGSSWATGLVIVTFAATDTAAIDSFGNALIEIQVADPLKQTWQIPVNVQKGLIA